MMFIIGGTWFISLPPIANVFMLLSRKNNNLDLFTNLDDLLLERDSKLVRHYLIS